MYKAHEALREECSTLHYVAATHVLSALRNDLYKDLMLTHSNKICRLMSKKLDVEEHIKNISSYRLSFFEKLVICRGLRFSLPQKVSPIDVQASFEKLYWKIHDKLSDPNLKELAASTLRSTALNYIQRKSPNPPKALVKALNRLKERDDIVITRPDKGSGTLVMDKEEYLRLLRQASIADASKFTPIDPNSPKTRGRPPKHFHPLLQKEKRVESSFTSSSS